MTIIEKVIAEAPDNFVIKDALIRCYEIVGEHNKIMCSVSGGADSDVMLDMLIRCGAKDKTDFVFFNTGLEYRATLEHLDDLEKKYDITIKRVRPKKSIPQAVKEYGVPFKSKFVSYCIHALQRLGFQYEDAPYEELLKKYPKSYMYWWCNIGNDGRRTTSQYTIDYNPGLKEFMMTNPPDFNISDKCCKYAKKDVAKRQIKEGGYDLECTGVRKNEGGVRALSYKTCFSWSQSKKIDSFRPVWWFRDSDKEEYCHHYDITHSRCYTQYGLKRTGCVGCPFNPKFQEDLPIIQQYEPALYKAALNIFGKSYEYTKLYMEYKEQRKREKTRHKE